MKPCPEPRRKTVRCAIYTRKSSDEGLEQSFNSLNAQREACSAYIRSQASEGWVESPELYDDGGLSGGTLARPALQRLLADVAAGSVDIIVVYKVDRLTRSLFDFAKLVEQLDAASTSFVSVTQSFNTTTSMGRLTLNMLLSFAQFEREVTAERIRDKIAASKARGMWMGGTPPIGYAPNDRSLTIVPKHAALVRQLYERYLALGTVRKLEQALIVEGVTIPERTTIGGKGIGGGHFTRGHLHQLLRNPVYSGRIAHRDKLYEGLHEAIIERPLWDAVQAQLAANLQGERTARVTRPSLLAGRIVDQQGLPLIATHACKPARGGGEGAKTRYRYYVSRGLQEGSAETGLRVPAREIESVVVERLAQTLDDPITLMATAWLAVASHEIGVFSDRCRALAQQVRAKAPGLVQQLISQVRIEDGRIVIACTPASIAAALDQRCDEQALATVELTSEVRLTRSGRAMRLVDQRGSVVTATPDKALLRLIVQARGWWAELRKGELDIKSLAAREKVAPSYMTRVVRLAFLAPQVIEAIITGRQGKGVTAISLTLRGEWPADWRSQRATMLAGAST